MSENTTLALDGLFTRFGCRLENFGGFEHFQEDDINDEPCWLWCFRADLVADDTGTRLEQRKVFMDQVFYDPSDPELGAIGQRNMQALSDACMKHLTENGSWRDEGRTWQPRAAA